MSHQEHEDFTEREYEQAQEEAHQHFVIQEFCHLILYLGPNSVLGLMEGEARAELIDAILNSENEIKGLKNCGDKMFDNEMKEVTS